MAGITMKDHLSDEQLNELVLGEAGSDADRHLEACATCRRKAQELKDALDGFRESIHATAGTYKLLWRAPRQSVRPAWARFMARQWAYAAALAVILVVSAVLRFDHRRTPTPATGAAIEDDIMREVQVDVSQSVPGALAPGELLLAGLEEPPSPNPAKAAGKAGNTRGRR